MLGITIEAVISGKYAPLPPNPFSPEFLTPMAISMVELYGILRYWLRPLKSANDLDESPDTKSSSKLLEKM